MAWDLLLNRLWNHSGGGVVGPEFEILALSLRERERYIYIYFFFFGVKKREREREREREGFSGVIREKEREENLVWYMVLKRRYMSSVFKEQIGHFEQLLDVFGISSNLGEVSGIYLN